MLLELLLLFQTSIHRSPTISVRTKDSLVIAENRYASILFTAESSLPNTAAPDQFSFRTAGDPPPGMIFESYPCHKPGVENCQALASSDGIYLDGVPTTAGSYHFTITAKDAAGHSGKEQFTIAVKSSK
jgi:hypothetical protein